MQGLLKSKIDWDTFKEYCCAFFPSLIRTAEQTDPTKRRMQLAGRMATFKPRHCVCLLTIVLALVVSVHGYTSLPGGATQCAKGQNRKYGPTGNVCTCTGTVY